MKTFQIVTLTAAMAVAVTLVPALLGESKARADAGPTGTWSGSCFDASVANGVLYAKCYTNARDLRNVSIAYGSCPGNSVANDDGYLICGR
jgi:hypothetical protein